MIRKTISALILPALVAVCIFTQVIALQRDSTKFYGLRIQGEHESALPLVSQDVDVKIHGSMAVVKLTQKYRNPFSKNIETLSARISKQNISSLKVRNRHCISLKQPMIMLLSEGRSLKKSKRKRNMK